MQNNYNPWGQVLKGYDLFISHSWEHGEDRDNLGKLITTNLVGSVRDYSATKDDPIHTKSDDELLLALNAIIPKAKVLVFPAGIYASHSRWIPIEIAIARHHNLPILAVLKWGAKKSSIMTNYASEVVNWNGKSVADAIRRWHG